MTGKCEREGACLYHIRPPEQHDFNDFPKTSGKMLRRT
jgi:hypothetical protein